MYIVNLRNRDNSFIHSFIHTLLLNYIWHFKSSFDIVKEIWIFNGKYDMFKNIQKDYMFSHQSELKCSSTKNMK